MAAQKLKTRVKRTQLAMVIWNVDTFAQPST